VLISAAVNQLVDAVRGAHVSLIQPASDLSEDLGLAPCAGVDGRYGDGGGGRDVGDGHRPVAVGQKQLER
jgi:hypothetical protein